MRKNKKPFVPLWVLKVLAWLGYVGLPVLFFFIPNGREAYKGSGLAILALILGSPVLLSTILVLYLTMHWRRSSD